MSGFVVEEADGTWMHKCVVSVLVWILFGQNILHADYALWQATAWHELD